VALESHDFSVHFFELTGIAVRAILLLGRLFLR